MPARKHIAESVEARVLLRSARRCCLCFQLEQDYTEKIGQIAHIDQNPLNTSDDNLAFLCLNHHTLYDSKTSQHKNYTAAEIKSARTVLYHEVQRRQAQFTWSGGLAESKVDPTTEPTAEEWEALEARFEKINGEVDATWRFYRDEGRVEWTLQPHPNRGGTPRTVQQFEIEARNAGLALQRLVANHPSRFPVSQGGPIDHWLNAAAALVHPESDWQTDGHDERGDHEGGFIHKALEASRIACAGLASQSRVHVTGLGRQRAATTSSVLEPASAIRQPPMRVRPTQFILGDPPWQPVEAPRERPWQSTSATVTVRKPPTSRKLAMDESARAVALQESVWEWPEASNGSFGVMSVDAVQSLEIRQRATTQALTLEVWNNRSDPVSAAQLFVERLDLWSDRLEEYCPSEAYGLAVRPVALKSIRSKGDGRIYHHAPKVFLLWPYSTGGAGQLVYETGKGRERQIEMGPGRWRFGLRVEAENKSAYWWVEVVCVTGEQPAFVVAETD